MAKQPISPQEALIQEFGTYYLADELMADWAKSLERWAWDSARRLIRRIGDAQAPDLIALLTAAQDDPEHPLVQTLCDETLVAWTDEPQEWHELQQLLETIAADLAFHLSSLQLPVNVRRQTVEEHPDRAALYEGIYELHLNRNVSVMFVPTFERTAHHWPPRLPDDLDAIQTAQEARLYTAAMSDYTVTPDDSRAWQVETIPHEALGDDPWHDGTLFFMSSDFFAVYDRELEALAARTPGLHDGIPISEIQELFVIQFVLGRVLGPPYFSPQDRDALSQGTK